MNAKRLPRDRPSRAAQSVISLVAAAAGLGMFVAGMAMERAGDLAGTVVHALITSHLLQFGGILLILTAVALGWVGPGRQAQREHELRERAEARYRALVEESPAIVYTWDPVRHEHIYVSPQVAPLLGYTPEEWGDGDVWLTAIHPDDVDEIRRLSARADREPDAHFRADYRVLTKDGRTVWVRDEARNIQATDDGRPALAQGVIYDITAQRNSDTRAREVEARFQTMVERVPAVAYAWQGGANPAPPTYVSPQLESLLGYRAEDWMADPMAWEAAVHPDDLETALAAWADASAAGRPFSAEYRVRHADGHLMWVRDDANPVGTGANGQALYQGVLHDVTERRQAEESLRDAEERSRLLVENLPVTAYMIEYEAGDHRKVVERWVGPSIAALLGIEPREWLVSPQTWVDAMHPDDRDRVLAGWEGAVSSGGRFEDEYRMFHRDGRMLWIHDEAAITVRGGGPRAEGVLMDVTARKTAEAAAGEAEERFRALVEHLPAITFLEDPATGKSLYVSPQIETIYGYTAEEWTADPDLWKRCLHPDDRDWVIAGDAADTGDTWSVEYRSLTRDGRVVWVRNEARLVRNPDGSPRFWLGLCSDITERKEAEERLRQAEGRYRNLIEQLPVAVYTDAADELSTALYVSPRYEELTGYSPEQRVRDPGLWARILHPDDRERVLAESDRTNLTGEPFHVRYRVNAADGRVVWLQDHATLVEDASGKKVWQGVLQDVTAEHLAQEALARRDEILEAAGFAAEAFLRADSWAGVIDDVLARLGLAGGASRAYVYANEVEQAPAPASILSHAWHAEGVDPRDALMPGPTPGWGDGFERCAAILRTGQVLHGPVSGFPEDERDLLGRMGVRSLLAVPITAEGDWWGCIGFDQCDADRVWHDAEIEALVVVASMLGAAIGRERAAARLAETERRFQTLVEQTPAVTYLDEADLEQPGRWHTVYLSPQAAETFGVPMEAWAEGAALWERLLHPDDRERAAQADRAHYETGQPLDIEIRIVRPDGSVRWLHDQALIVRDDEGRMRFSQGIILDVTEQKAAEEALREAEERYRGIVEHVPAAIYLDKADASMQTVYMSPQIESMLGVSAEDWLADPELWLTMMEPEDRDAVVSTYQDAARSGTRWQAEYRLHTPDGRTIWVHDETTFLHDERGVPRYLQGVLMDITERKLAEQALRESERREREAAERLRALDEMKNTFLAAVSHELRSPLTSILGLSLTLERAPDIAAEDRDDLLRRLAANARKLDRLLKDLLDIDRLNRGIVEPQIRIIDVGAIARRTVESLDALAGRDVTVQADPVVLGVDPAKVERIVENLLMNAARHTDADRRIWLRVQASEGGVLIAVEDDGPGVPADIRAAIFEPFRQGPTASPHAPGTGIGLSLVARFAGLHGGHAWVADRDGGGASFRVWLPGVEASSQVPSAVSDENGHADVTQEPAAAAG